MCTSFPLVSMPAAVCPAACQGWGASPTARLQHWVVLIQLPARLRPGCLHRGAAVRLLAIPVVALRDTKWSREIRSRLAAGPPQGACGGGSVAPSLACGAGQHEGAARINFRAAGHPRHPPVRALPGCGAAAGRGRPGWCTGCPCCPAPRPTPPCCRPRGRLPPACAAACEPFHAS